MTLDLNELANMPGYGKAQEVLRSNGKWDESAVLDGTKEYQVTVKVSGTYIPQVEHQSVKVKASTKEDAHDLACDLTDFDEIEDSEIMEVSECD